MVCLTAEKSFYIIFDQRLYGCVKYILSKKQKKAKKFMKKSKNMNLIKSFYQSFHFKSKTKRLRGRLV